MQYSCASARPTRTPTAVASAKPIIQPLRDAIALCNLLASVALRPKCGDRVGCAVRGATSRHAVPAMRLVGGSLRQPIIVGRHGLELRLLEGDREPPVDDHADRNVSDREALAHHV